MVFCNILVCNKIHWIIHPRPVRETGFSEPLLFQDLGVRKVVADFSGGRLSSDGGVLLLRQVDAGLGLSRRLARCFVDRRRQDLIGHSVAELRARAALRAGAGLRGSQS